MKHYFRYREPVVMLVAVIILVLTVLFLWVKAQADTSKTVDGVVPEPLTEETTESSHTLEYHF